MHDGEPLRIAIPRMPDPWGGNDYKQIIIDTLGLHGLPKGSVGVGSVFCSLLNRGGGGERSLQSYMGEIVDVQRLTNVPCYPVDVIIVEINGKGAPTRWPGGPVVFEEDEN